MCVFATVHLPCVPCSCSSLARHVQCMKWNFAMINVLASYNDLSGSICTTMFTCIIVLCLLFLFPHLSLPLPPLSVLSPWLCRETVLHLCQRAILQVCPLTLNLSLFWSQSQPPLLPHISTCLERRGIAAMCTNLEYSASTPYLCFCLRMVQIIKTLACYTHTCTGIVLV